MDTIQDIAFEMIMRMTVHKVVSINRLIKFIYLVDWSATLNQSNKISGLNWYNGLCGPCDRNILIAIQNSKAIFDVQRRLNDEDTLNVAIKDCTYSPSISEKVRLSIAHIERVANRLPWDRLSLLVASTYPMLVSQVGDELDLIKYASEYKKIIAAK